MSAEQRKERCLAWGAGPPLLRVLLVPSLAHARESSRLSGASGSLSSENKLRLQVLFRSFLDLRRGRKSLGRIREGLLGSLL